MMVIWLVCGVIGWDLLIKFVGYYYGYFDGLFVEVGLGVVMFGLFGFVGVFEVIVVFIVVLFYNDFDVVWEVFVVYFGCIVVVIIEVVGVNVGVFVLICGFNCVLFIIVYENGVLLILDEVFIGFCVGVVGWWGFEVVWVVFDGVGWMFDIIVFGKVIGGGMLFVVFGGCVFIMD